MEDVLAEFHTLNVCSVLRLTCAQAVLILFYMNNTETAATVTLPCNTATECAFLRFLREAVILGSKHGVFQGMDRSALVKAIRAADVEMATDLALGVVVGLMVKSEEEEVRRIGRANTAAYINLRDLGRQARVIPTV